MKTRPQHPDSWKLLKFLQQASEPQGYLNYCDYIRAALYHPQWGYYQGDRNRVGRHGESDYYTSQSLGKVFAEMVLEAARKLLNQCRMGSGPALEDFTFVEIGCEPGPNWFAKTAHPFGKMDHYGVNDPLHLSGPCVVFSNELFDAQPFYRTVFMDGAWRELGVAVSADGLDEIFLEDFSPAVAGFRPQLPSTAVEGYQLDLPLPSVDLLHHIAQTRWSGLFIALDYGKSWEELIHQSPGGSGRAYSRHRQKPNLLEEPGQQDITCHICWTWLMEELERSGFKSIHLESQEAFFLKHAGKTIERIITACPGAFQRDRQTLKHLLHPAVMGQQFQALWAYRPES
ncbi:MAG: hypothetical protein F7O42_03445 [Opitutae bacterium]|nr:hypothetical protein [Opitutae bacterium]